MEFRSLPDFSNYQINEDGSHIIIVKNEQTEEVPIKDKTASLKHDRSNKPKKYKIRNLVALAFLKYPLKSGNISYIEGDNNHYANLKWEEIKRDYTDINFLTKYSIEIVDLPRYPSQSVTSDGHIISRKTGRVMLENYKQKDGKGRVRLPLNRVKKNERTKDETVLIEDLVSAIFLKKPRDATILKRKNGLERDNSRDNFEWICSGDAPLSFLRKDKSITEVYKMQIKKTEDFSSHEVLDEEDPEFDEVRQDVFYGEEQEDENTSSIIESETTADEAEDEDDDLQTDLSVKREYFPIYEEFELSEVEYDLSDAVKMEGQLWKIARYKGEMFEGFMISENLDLFSKKLGRIVRDDDGNVRVSNKGEGYTRKYIFNRDLVLDIKDIAASTFLKVPDNAVIAVYRRWNKNNKEGKYHGQKNHYTNIKWLTNHDFAYVGNKKEDILISRQGDLYSMRYLKGYKLLKELVVKENHLRKVKVSLKKSEGKYKTYQLHIETALAFVKRPNKNYKYVLFKDGDVSNVHYRNLIWIDTLSGYHGDKIKYFEIPGYPEYVLSETNVPCSFKKGTLKIMKLHTDLKGYKRINLRKTTNISKLLLFHRVVAMTRKSDYSDDIWIDHINRIRGDCRPENLRNVTPKENSANYTPYRRGKEVLQIDPETGNVIATFGNSKMAVLELGSDFQKLLINKCALKNSKNDINRDTYKGFIWKYLIKKEKYICKPGEIFFIIFGNFQGLEIVCDNYMISNFGTIVNIKTGFAKCYTSDGYPAVKLSHKGVDISCYVHSLVAHIFVPGKTALRYRVNHLDENIYNYRADNLSWVTNKENAEYSAYKRGKPVKKICMNTSQVIGIFNSYEEGARSCGKPNHGWCISKACSGEFSNAYGFNWKDVPLNEIPLYKELEINKRKELFKTDK